MTSWPTEGPLLWALVIGGVVLLLIYAGLLWDISRSEVRHLPRWMWALIVVLITFPIGAPAYLAHVQQVCDVVGVIDHGQLRYQGPIAELLARTSSAYSLHVRGDAAALVVALQAAPWVREVEELAPGRPRLVTDDAPCAEQALPRLVADHGLALVSSNPATDPETALLELTR